MPDDAAGGVAVEDEVVLGEGHAAGRVDDGVEVGVGRAAADVVERRSARELEAGAQLDEGLHLAQRPHRRRPPGPARTELTRPRLQAGVLPAVRAGEVDQLAGGEEGGEPATCFGVDLRPRPRR